MGRWEVWSDLQVQELAKEFVCVADECWDLCPPDWHKREWLKTPKSTELFEKFLTRTPKGLLPGGGATCQGTYCMTAEGEYLAGGFAWVNRERTIKLLESALAKFREREFAMKPVPQEKLPFYVGEKPKKGGLKLQLGYRDLPRGGDRLPNTERIKRPVNLGFLDLSAEEVLEFLPKGRGENNLPQQLVKRISEEALKDCARGQCNVAKGSFKEGGWRVRELKREAGKRTIELQGSSLLESEVHYQPTVFGHLEYDEQRKRFVKFDIIAVGQRSGSARFNFRGGDEEAAPLGVAMRLFVAGN